MKRALVVLILFCLSLQATADTGKGLSWGWQTFSVAGQAADGVSTIGHPELNPTMRWVADKPAALGAFKASFGLAIGRLGDWLSRHGHPGWAKVLCALSGGAGFGAAVHNWRAR